MAFRLVLACVLSVWIFSKGSSGATVDPRCALVTPWARPTAARSVRRARPHQRCGFRCFQTRRALGNDLLHLSVEKVAKRKAFSTSFDVKRSNSAIPVLIVGSLVLQGVFLSVPVRPAHALLTRDQVERVVDGDTVVTRSTGRIRMIGVDTPETVSPAQREQGVPPECFGPEASAVTKKLLPPGTEVRLETDKEPQDKYGRNLAYIFRSSDGMFVNGQLVKDGYARAKSYGVNTKYQDLLQKYQNEAQAAKRGLWGKCDFNAFSSSTPTSSRSTLTTAPATGAVGCQESKKNGLLANPGDAKNCKDFQDYAEAKAWYDKYFPLYGDVARLDGDGNGIPCERLPGAPRKQSSSGD